MLLLRYFFFLFSLRARDNTIRSGCRHWVVPGLRDIIDWGLRWFVHICVCGCVSVSRAGVVEIQSLNHPPLLLWRELDSFLVMVSGLTTYSAVCMYTMHVLYNRVHSEP